MLFTIVKLDKSTAIQVKKKKIHEWHRITEVNKGYHESTNSCDASTQWKSFMPFMVFKNLLHTIREIFYLHLWYEYEL